MSLPAKLSAWWLANPALPVRIGDVHLLPGQKQCAFVFNWAIPSGWITPQPLNTNNEWLPVGDRGLPSFLEDCCPDRWGQLVIRKIEKPARLAPIDYLYMAGDGRFGALGFSTDEASYIPGEASPAVLLESLGEIDTLIRRIRAGEKVDERQRRLIRPSKTLGGARPKTQVVIDGALWIAKFPQADDPVDLGRMEYASNKLQIACGIDAVECDVMAIPTGHVFLTRRFDRAGAMRLHCISAQTMMLTQDASLTDLYSYLLLADGLRMADSRGARAGCHELFRRMAFNVLMDNTDDHEKNHSLVLQEGQWCLSRAYDALPQLTGLGAQAMSVGRHGAAGTMENVLSAHDRFLLDEKEARSICREVAKHIDSWKEVFMAHGVSPVDIETIEPFVDRDDLRAIRRDIQRVAADQCTADDAPRTSRSASPRG
jgi:serine/threonine-protein kinase HipA